jgi:hypothetical protein
VKINWRKWNRILHRDLGYFFFAVTLIYALSGIALNHLADWNPSYQVSRDEVIWTGNQSADTIDKQVVLNFLQEYEQANNYKKHYFPAENWLKIFLQSGSVEINLSTGKGFIEILERRPLFYEVNYLHYNPKRLWTWFSDIYCVALIIIAITGLFVLKGKKGITGRGAWLTSIGLLVPLGFLFFYL